MTSRRSSSRPPHAKVRRVDRDERRQHDRVDPLAARRMDSCGSTLRRRRRPDARERRARPQARPVRHPACRRPRSATDARRAPAVMGAQEARDGEDGPRRRRATGPIRGIAGRVWSSCGAVGSRHRSGPRSSLAGRDAVRLEYRRTPRSWRPHGTDQPRTPPLWIGGRAVAPSTTRYGEVRIPPRLKSIRHVPGQRRRRRRRACAPPPRRCPPGAPRRRCAVRAC